MKIRTSYVSNSSSSSFLVSWNSISDFDRIGRNTRGYNRFIKDVKEHNNNKKEILVFLQREFTDLVCGYYHHVCYGDRFFNKYANIRKDFKTLCEGLNCDAEGMQAFVNEAKKEIDGCVSNNGKYDSSKIGRMAQAFAYAVYETMYLRWRNMSVIEYFDDVDSYMEHDFMYGIVSGKEGEFGLRIRNNH